MNPTAATKSPAPALPFELNTRLSVMMFLQYAIWGAWLPLFASFLTEHRGFSADETGWLFAYAAIGALFAPFIAGQIADRWFRTERFLAVSHIVGGILVWQLARFESYGQLVVFGLLYSFVYAPTLPLTNSLAFHHIPDRDRDFGRVRVWGTIGWIVAGIAIGQWLLHVHTPAGTDTEIRAAQVAGMGDSFRLSGILGIALGLYSLTLPSTPPAAGRQRFAPLEALGYVKKMPLVALFLISFPIACAHQFYFFHTAGFLSTLKHPAGDAINRVFGVGGAGLMTIGQMAEILVLALMPILARKISRKGLLAIGLAAYVTRFAIFAYFPEPAVVLPALALHGLVFGCFFFVAFMIVDEETPSDVRASAQSLFNFVVVAFGTIAGNLFAGKVATWASSAGQGETMDYERLFAVPMWICVACFFALVAFYPGRRAAGSSLAP